MTTRTMSSNEAKQNWGSVLSTASSDPDGVVIVESHGKPKAAVISIERFEKLRELEQQDKRARALELLRQIEKNYDGRNDDLSEEEINDLSVRFSREFYKELAEKRQLQFERDQS